MHFMPNNDLEGNMSHFILIASTKKILCFQKLHFKFLELKNCIWGARIQDPASFAGLVTRLARIGAEMQKVASAASTAGVEKSILV